MTGFAKSTPATRRHVLEERVEGMASEDVMECGCGVKQDKSWVEGREVGKNHYILKWYRGEES